MLLISSYGSSSTSEHFFFRNWFFLLLFTFTTQLLWFCILFVLCFLTNCIFTRCESVVRVATPLKAGEAAMTVTTMEVKMESRWPENDELSAPINLGLQIGTNSAGNQSERTSIVHRRTESLLTVGQLHELQQQVLIHKHLVAGLRVPTHLLIPIWKSVVRNLGSNINGMYERYRSRKRV